MNFTYDTEDFETDVIQKSHAVPILVDFWADWCGPCKVLGPILESLAQQNGGEWLLAKVDTEKHPTIAARYQIKGIPNVKLFVDGQVTDEFVGARSEQQVVEWLDTALPSKYQLQLDGAKQLITENKVQQATELLEVVLAAEPNNEEALVLLAQALLASDPRQAMKIIEPIGMDSKYFDRVEAVRTLYDLFDRINEPQSLDEKPIKNTYLKAIHAVKSNSFESALDGFIETVRNDRYYDKDGARKACIAIFDLLGSDHEFTKHFRPTLGSALF